LNHSINILKNVKGLLGDHFNQRSDQNDQMGVVKMTIGERTFL